MRRHADLAMGWWGERRGRVRRADARRCWIAAALAWTAATPAVLAQDDLDEWKAAGDYTDVDLASLLDVDVTGSSRYRKSAREVAAPVVVITAEQIKSRGYRDLKDVFYDVAGFDVSGNVQGEVRTLVILRGVLGNQKLLILQDGQRLNAISGERFVYGNNVPIHHAKRIEIIYGPSASVYGPDAYAGVVNIVTMDGADIEGLSASANAGLLSMNPEAGATDASLVFGKTLGHDADVLVSARLYWTGRGPELSRSYDELRPIAYYGDDYQHAEPVFDYDLYAKVKMGGFTFGARYNDASETNAPSTIPDQYLAISENVWRQRQHHAFATYQNYFGPVETSTTIRYQQYEVDPASNFYIVQSFENQPWAINWDGQPIKIPTAASKEYKYALTHSVRLEENLRFVASDRVTVQGGALLESVLAFPKTKNLRDGRFDPDHLVVSMDEFADPETGLVLGVSEDRTWGVRPYTNTGAYSEVELRPADNIHINAGGRVDYNSIYGFTGNPRLGLVWRALQALTLRLSGGTAYIQPSPYYVWENWANPFAMHVPNVDLKPERIISANVGGNVEVTSQINVTADIFYNHIIDVIRPVPIDPTVFNPFLIIPPESAYVEINANQGVQFTYGGELKIDYVTSWLHAFGSYAYLAGRDGQTRSDINKISHHKVLVGADVKIADRLTFSPRLRWFSGVVMAPFNTLYQQRQAEAVAAGQPADSADNTFGGPAGQWLLNASLRGRVVEGLEVHLTMNNILNQRYYTAAPYGESVWILPRAPQLTFNFMAGMSYRYGL